MSSASRAPLAPHAVLLFVQVAFASLAVEGKLAMGPAIGVAPAALAMARIAGAAVCFGLLAARLKEFSGRRGVRQAAGLLVLAFGVWGLFAVFRLLAAG